MGYRDDLRNIEDVVDGADDARVGDKDDVMAALLSFHASHPKGAFARDICKGVEWATHGSDRRLDKALQALRRAGRIEYVKKCGWRPVRVAEQAAR